MASIKKRPNGRWRARYRDAAGKEHARHFDRKTDAQRWIDEVTASVVTGQYVDPRRARTPFREYVEHWRSIQVVRDQTRININAALRTHILPALGDRQIGSILPSDIQSLVKTMGETRKPGTVMSVLKILRRIFASAVTDRYIPSSPCVNIQVPQSKEADDGFVLLTIEQVGTLAGAVPARFRAAVILLAGSGLRIGEALGLRVSDVNFLRRTVQVERQRVRPNGVGPLKTKASRRTVPLGQVVVDELAAHLAAFPSEEWLFTDELGRGVTYSQWTKMWPAARAAAGVEADTHDLRHFYASVLIAAGLSVKVVQERLGHGSATVTLDTYSHLWPDDDDATREATDAAFGPLADPGRTGTAKGL